MTMTQEEIRKVDEEDPKYILERYSEWQKLSPEEQQEMRCGDEDDIVALSREWLNLDERRQFDKQYAEKHEPARSEDEANRLEN